MVILYLTLYVYDMISMMLIWCSVGGTERQPILFNKWVGTMFVERKVCYSALFTNLVGWHASAVSFPPK
jgi:hypothetical protein